MIKNYLKYVAYTTLIAVLAVSTFSQNSANAQTVLTDEPTSDIASDCISLTHFLKAGSSDASTGGEVSLIQGFLAESGYFDGPAVGYFGNRTQRSVKSFQSANGIPSTGNIGPLTGAKIKALSCGDSTAILNEGPSTNIPVPALVCPAGYICEPVEKWNQTKPNTVTVRQPNTGTPGVIQVPDYQVNFENEFNLSQVTPNTTLSVLADNTYEVSINGTLVAVNSNRVNHVSPTIHNVTQYLKIGMNKISFRVTNDGSEGGSFTENPGGIMYRLSDGSNNAIVTSGTNDKVTWSPRGYTGNATVLSYIHVAWGNIDGAKWIWDHNPSLNTVTPTQQVLPVLPVVPVPVRPLTPPTPPTPPIVPVPVINPVATTTASVTVDWENFNNPPVDTYENPRIKIDGETWVTYHDNTTATKWCQNVAGKSYTSGTSLIAIANPQDGVRAKWDGTAWSQVNGGNYPRFYKCSVN